LLEAGFDYARQGGNLDFTTSTTEQIIEQGETPAAKALAMALTQGIDVSQLTMSSDGNASLPSFDEHGLLMELEVGRVSSLHQSMVDAVLIHQVPLALALASITKSPANILSLKQKGQIKVGNDADINLLDPSTLSIKRVIAKGRDVTVPSN